MEYNILLEYFGFNVRVFSGNKHIINRIQYIFRYFISKDLNRKEDITFRANSLNSLSDIELISSSEKFDISYSYDREKFFPWKFSDTFLPPMRITPFNNKYLVLHGCAARRDGKTYAFLAPSMAGKTSLLFYLLDKGFYAISDDLLFIDIRTGYLYPYKKPVGVREGSLNVIPHLDEFVRNTISDETMIFYNNEGKKTWLMHLDDLFDRNVYYEKETKIDYFIMPNKMNEGDIEKLKPYNAFEYLTKALCNSGLEEETVNTQVINILAETESFYLPTLNLEEAYLNINKIK